MNNKKLINKLTRVASILEAEEFVICDLELKTDSISLSNWKSKMIPQVALNSICQLCNKFHLFYFVDFVFHRVIIYG